ncbi:galactose-specific lectin nattectin-like [Entelurus aequoreus]|uniref:galactose-specific lectin nattectin-like n=1 Tax=Entelurus aequoreus TaxID=161455 RepID=UPI002B1D5650|nr:galactose-specific lectin nattectin-like [Entelurus aequoreus]
MFFASPQWSIAIKEDDCCPEGWTQLDMRCFIFQNERVDFITAETTCIILGGNLVSIHSNLENELVRQLIFDVTGQNTRTWIGFTDAIREGSFIWTDGSVVDFTDWANNRPSSNGNRNCANINFRGGLMQPVSLRPLWLKLRPQGSGSVHLSFSKLKLLHFLFQQPRFS